jgi:PAS domain S-box-containing protein
LPDKCLPLPPAGGTTHGKGANFPGVNFNRFSHELMQDEFASEAAPLPSDALRESEAKFRAIANLVPDLLWRNDTQGSTRWYNQRWYDYTGQTPAESLYNGWLLVIHPDDQAQSFHTFQLAVSTGQSLRQEHRIRSVSGEYRWFQVTAEPIYDDQGRISHWYGAATDIHERKVAELATQERRDLLQSIFDMSLFAMSMLQAVRDEQGEVQDFKILLTNKELEQQTGRADLVGKYYAAEYPGIRQVGLFDLLLLTLASGQPTALEYHYDHEGLNRWFSCQFIKLNDGIIATNLDITERKLAEQERTLNLRLLEQSEKIAELGNWDYELATGTFRWSAGMYRLFGLAPGTPVSPTIYLDFVVAEDRPIAERLVRHLREGSAGFEKILRLQVGEHLKTLRLKAVMFYDDQGQPARMLGVDLDISELKRLEADNLRLRLGQQQARVAAVLTAQEEERRRMAESPHNGIGQLLFAAKLQLGQLTVAPEFAATKREADRLLSEAIQQARTISHELTPVIIAEVGLAKAIREICRNFDSPALRWQCIVHLDEEHLVPELLQVALYRLAQELAQNVMKHAQASYAIIEVDTIPGWIVLRVEDNGRGFEAGATTTGIGLKTLRDRVTLLDGLVYIEATLGKGSQVQVRLPLPSLLLA